jgi:hypothetical protein
MKNFILICVILICVSCNPCKMLSKRCKPEVRDSIVYKEIVKLDTLRLILPGDTTILEVPVDLTDYSLAEENSNQKIQLSILKGKLRLITICKDDSLQVVIKNLEKRLSEQKTVIVEKEVIKNKVPKWCWYLLIANIIIVIVIFGWTFLKYKAKILGMLGK